MSAVTIVTRTATIADGDDTSGEIDVRGCGGGRLICRSASKAGTHVRVWHSRTDGEWWLDATELEVAAEQSTPYLQLLGSTKIKLQTTDGSGGAESQTSDVEWELWLVEGMA